MIFYRRVQESLLFHPDLEVQQNQEVLVVQQALEVRRALELQQVLEVLEDSQSQM